MARISLSEIAGEIEDHEIEVIPGRWFPATGDVALPALLELRAHAASGGLDLSTPEKTEESMRLLQGFLDGVFMGRGAEVLSLVGLKRFGALMQVIVQLYGLAGEAPASSTSSSSTGEPSRPTSNGSTGSTSVTPASVMPGDELEYVGSPV